MNLSPEELAKTLLTLQAVALTCARVFDTPDTAVEYRVVFCSGDPHPWRLTEMHRALGAAGKPWVLRRMHCFSAPLLMQRSLQERMRWKGADRTLIARYKQQSGAAVGEGEFNLAVLSEERRALRARM